MSDIPSEYLETAAAVVMGSKAKCEYGGPADVDKMIEDVALAIFKAKGFDLYVIWSNANDAWYRPNSRGYTKKLCEAGHYDRADAMMIAQRIYPSLFAIALDDAEAMSGER